jgi:hypothetical protein
LLEVALWSIYKQARKPVSMREVLRHRAWGRSRVPGYEEF